jgi:cytochrome oxidase Cu insertion factor (SCO1/SenC/PrrC family)
VPGMTSGLNPGNSTLTTAFKSALLNQGVLALLVFAVLAIAWVACRELLPGWARAGLAARQRELGPEPAGRRIVRIGFGVLWVFDAILQAQPAMPGGLPSQVVAPAADGSPGWVRELVNWAGTGWSYHPVQDAAAAVWIQLGIGVWLLASARGRWSQAAGLACTGWGLVVWVFGEAFGGVFGQGLSLLTGAPGAALLYAVGGVLIAVPARFWASAAFGRWWLRLVGLGLVAGAVLQSWPGRGYWQGTLGGQPGSLTDMVQSMAGTPQPGFLARLVTGFGDFVSAHGFAVNLLAVVLLAGGGAALLSGRQRVLRPAVITLTAFFLATWVLVQDLGFFGGLGTDPNSMIPVILLVTGAFATVATGPVAAPAANAAESPAVAGPEGAPTPVPDPVTAATAAALGSPQQASDSGPPAGERRRPARRLRLAVGTASASVVVALWAGAVMLLGAEPMAVAEVQRTADPILATSLNGEPSVVDRPSVPFDLTDQHGRQVTLAGLRGKVVLLTFLDPVCVSDCPLVAQQFRAADQMLGSKAGDVALVAIVANPVYRSLAYTRAFDREESLTGLRNWYFLTGSLPQLTTAWHEYYVTAELNGPGAMVLHPDVAYVIDRSGQERLELNLDPGPGTASSQSSFAAELAQAARQVLGSK